MIPVECASAFGGVEIGRIMARDAHIATPTINDLRPPRAMNDSLAVGSSRSAVPTTARIGTMRLAAAEFEMKFERSQQMRPPATITTRIFHDAKGTALIRADARPVLLRAVPRAKPPATIQSTLQSISLRSSLENTPVAVNTANGMRATMFALTLKMASPIQRMMVRAKVMETMVL